MAIELWWCEIWGDLAADRAADQYPTVPVCADCISADQNTSGEDKRILSVGDVVNDPREECYFRDNHPDDE
ncbi:MAG: hypothetical protein J0H27_06445 [Xanthomonadales bacterium]|nr:hypothetical protein [Xanthomonadales bacterium]ODU94477.1 MAG: hypothetical protein ABT18_05105 [Rhodanobacter sp. SCN 66-43]OJY87085.1 MAG: hypothetical protein BGP23_13260 [Xanthomonadales bacterium 66-474]